MALATALHPFADEEELALHQKGQLATGAVDAVLDAMEEPTEGMIEAAEQYDAGQYHGLSDHRAPAKTHWQEMIRAAKAGR